MESVFRSIYDWMTFINPSAAVLVAPVLDDRPTGDYLTYQVINVLPMRDGYKHTVAGERFTHAEMIVSVNAYSPAGASLINNLNQSNDWWDASQKLLGHGENLSFVDGTGPNNLTALGDESWRSRWQADLRFTLDIKQDRTFYAINQWLLDGTWVTADGVDIIRTSAEWP